MFKFNLSNTIHSIIYHLFPINLKFVFIIIYEYTILDCT